MTYILALFWKFVSNICPPAHYWKGWPCTIIALIAIAGITIVLAEVSALLSCVMGIKPGVLGITLIAVGTQVPSLIST